MAVQAPSNALAVNIATIRLPDVIFKMPPGALKRGQILAEFNSSLYVAFWQTLRNSGHRTSRLPLPQASLSSCSISAIGSLPCAFM